MGTGEGAGAVPTGVPTPRPVRCGGPFGVVTGRIAVVGAGPAGSVAAYVLARAGASVDLIERGAFSRDKACGDLVALEGVRELEELGLAEVMADAWWATTAAAEPDGSGRSAFGRLRNVEGPRRPVLARRVFDARLRDAAVAAGAVPVQAAVRRLDRDGDAAVVLGLVDRNGDVTTRRYAFVVGADGSASTVARLAGLTRIPRDDRLTAVRRYARFDGPVPARLAFFGREDSIGYAWAFSRADDSVNIGVGAPAPLPGRELRRRLTQFESHLGDLLEVDARVVELGDVLAGGIRCDFDPLRVSAGRVVLVGDAAGLADGVSGGGITEAIRSGRVAAEHLVASGTNPATGLTIACAFETMFGASSRAGRNGVARGSWLYGDGPQPSRAVAVSVPADPVLGEPVGWFEWVDLDGRRWSPRSVRGVWVAFVAVDAGDAPGVAALAARGAELGGLGVAVVLVAVGGDPGRFGHGHGFPVVAHPGGTFAGCLIDPEGRVRGFPDAADRSVADRIVELVGRGFPDGAPAGSGLGASVVAVSQPPVEAPELSRWDDATVFAPAPGSGAVSVADQTLVVNASVGGALVLGEFDAAVWRLFDGRTRLGELVDDLCAGLYVAEPVVRPRLDWLLASLVDEGLVEPVDGERRGPVAVGAGSVGEPDGVEVSGPFVTAGRAAVVLDRSVRAAVAGRLDAVFVPDGFGLVREAGLVTPGGADDPPVLVVPASPDGPVRSGLRRFEVAGVLTGRSAPRGLAEALGPLRGVWGLEPSGPIRVRRVSGGPFAVLAGVVGLLDTGR